MVLQNVPGPAEPVSFADHEIHAVHMIHTNIIPQLTFLSYRGTIFGNAIVGITTDNTNSNNDETTSRMVPSSHEQCFNIGLLASKLKVPDVPEGVAGCGPRHTAICIKITRQQRM